jgi:hypothetical protein
MEGEKGASMKEKSKPLFPTLAKLVIIAALTVIVGSVPLTAGQSEPAIVNPASISNLLVSHQWIGSDGKPLPFKTDEEILDFLRTAEIVEIEKIPEGVTKPQKLYLEKDGIKAAAVFRDKEIHKKRWNDPSAGPRVDFRDSCVYECAAYRLSRLLGLNNVPPTVRRKVKGKKGTVQIWIEGAMTDTHRLRAKILPPDTRRWSRQDQVMKLWDQLLFNDDRNRGNVLIDQHWNVWLIDHTRCFRVYDDVPEVQKIKYCERSLWEKLRNLDEEVVRVELSDYLRSPEIDGLLKRRTRLIKHIEALIEERGENVVLFEFRPEKAEMASSAR